MAEQKVFQIGFNKCGTKSIAEFLRLTGYSHFDWQNDIDGNGALRIAENINNGRPVLSGLDHYDSFTDLGYVSEERIVEAHRYIDSFLREYPKAKFILNIRNKDAWLRSRREHLDGDFLRRYMVFYGFDEEGVIAQWSRDWDEHIAYVKETVPAEQLFVLDIDRTPVTALSQFLGVDGPKKLGHRNFTLRGPVSRFLVGRLSPRVKRRIPQGVRQRVKRAIRHF